MTGGYTERELMVVAAAREIRDAEVVFVGMRLPLLAFALATRTHAPGALGVFENGIVREHPAPETLYTMSDPPNVPGALWCTSTGHIMALGIRADPGARLSGTFRAGIEFRSPKVGVDLTRPFAEGSLGYQMTRRLSTSLFLSRAIEASTNQNFPSIDTTIMTLGLAYQVTRKVSAFTQGTFEVDEFGTRVRSGEGVPERRSDRLYAVGMGGNYRFARWLTGSLSYLHQTKNSNLTRINFVENQVILHITACPSLLLEGLTSPIRCPTLPSP